MSALEPKWKREKASPMPMMRMRMAVDPLRGGTAGFRRAAGAIIRSARLEFSYDRSVAKPSSNLRLFVGIYPPREVAEAMLNAMAELKLPAHRPTLCEQVHLTLQFIGDTPARELDATIESVERGAAGLSAFELSAERLIQLPERGPARLVAAQTDAPPTLVELHRRLAMRLARNVRDRNEERFRPHLTLCRF